MARVIEYCKALLETLCLFALIAVPLYFNIFSDRVFEHDKVSVFRSIALVMGALAIIIWLLKASRTPLRKLLKPGHLLGYPLGLPVVLLAIAIMISVFFAITPRSSFWGTYLRPDGAYTSLCYLVFFACTYFVLTSSRQIERIITVIVLTSLPIVLYSLLQRYGWDHQAWSGNTSRRVIGTIGNPIFFAAYLIMIFPLTVRQVISTFTAARRDPENRIANYCMSFLYLQITVLQLLAMAMSGSRGPALALMVGALFFVCIYLLRYRFYRLTLTAIALPFVFGMILLFLPHGGPIKSSGADTAIQRFAHLLNPQYKTSKVRILIWGAMANVVSDDEAMTYPSGQKDWFDPVRLLIGYGPEGIVDAVSPYYPAELGQIEKRTQMPDRSHNETWDWIIQHGLLGLSLFYFIFGALFLYAFDYMGFARERADRIRYMLCLVGGVVAGTLVALVRGGLAFIGLGISLGFIAGVFFYLWRLAWTQRKAPDRDATPSSPPHFALMAAVATAVMAHFAEIQVGIAAITTRTFFWVFAALILAIYQRDLKPATAREEAEGLTSVRYGMIWSVITAMILGTTLYNALTIFNAPPELLNAPFAIIKHHIGMLTLCVWIVIPLMAVLIRSRTTSFMTCVLLFIGMLFGSGLITWAYVSWHTTGQAQLGDMLYASVEQVKEHTHGFGYLFTRYCIYTFLLSVVAAIALASRSSHVKARFTPTAAVVTPVLIVLAIVAIYFTNIRIIHANMCFKTASGFLKFGKLDSAEVMYRNAINLAPREDRYYFGIAQAVHGKAKIARSREEAESEMQRAIDLSKQAHELNPLKPDHLANIALLYRWWAENTRDAFRRRQLGEIADEYYDASLQLLPQYVPYWCDRAVLHFNVLGQPGVVEHILKKAIKLDPKYVPSHLLIGDHYARMGKQEKEREQRFKLFKKAVEHYEEAIQLSGKKGLDNPYPVHVAASRAYGELEDLKNLLYHAEKAFPYAPEQDRERLATLIETSRERLQ